MKFSPYGSPIPRFSRVSSRNSEGFPNAGPLNEGGIGKIGDFRPLEASNYGCYVTGKFFGCIMYPDDLLLLSATCLLYTSDAADE